MTDDARICVAFTGASGTLYGIRLIELLLKAERKVDVIFSKAALLVAAMETDLKIPAKVSAQQVALSLYFQSDPDQLRVFGREDWMAPWASGSGQPGSVVICPCSTGSMSAIASGASNNLIERAADVALKERRQLILVPRETPYSEVHLSNMLSLTRMGAIILPASPGFYHKPSSVGELVDFIVARILTQLGVPQTVLPIWGQSKATNLNGGVV